MTASPPANSEFTQQTASILAGLMHATMALRQQRLALEGQKDSKKALAAEFADVEAERLLPNWELDTLKNLDNECGGFASLDLRDSFARISRTKPGIIKTLFVNHAEWRRDENHDELQAARTRLKAHLLGMQNSGNSNLADIIRVNREIVDIDDEIRSLAGKEKMLDEQLKLVRALQTKARKNGMESIPETVRSEVSAKAAAISKSQSAHASKNPDGKKSGSSSSGSGYRSGSSGGFRSGSGGGSRFDSVYVDHYYASDDFMDLFIWQATGQPTSLRTLIYDLFVDHGGSNPVDDPRYFEHPENQDPQADSISDPDADLRDSPELDPNNIDVERDSAAEGSEPGGDNVDGNGDSNVGSNDDNGGTASWNDSGSTPTESSHGAFS